MFCLLKMFWRSVDCLLRMQNWDGWRKVWRWWPFKDSFGKSTCQWGERGIGLKTHLMIGVWPKTIGLLSIEATRFISFLKAYLCIFACFDCDRLTLPSTDCPLMASLISAIFAHPECSATTSRAWMTGARIWPNWDWLDFEIEHKLD